MRKILQIASWLALAATVVPSMAFLAGAAELHVVKTIMLIGTFARFILTPCWMERAEKA